MKAPAGKIWQLQIEMSHGWLTAAHFFNRTNVGDLFAYRRRRLRLVNATDDRIAEAYDAERRRLLPTGVDREGGTILLRGFLSDWPQRRKK